MVDGYTPSKICAKIWRAERFKEKLSLIYIWLCYQKNTEKYLSKTRQITRKSELLNN